MNAIITNLLISLMMTPSAFSENGPYHVQPCGDFAVTGSGENPAWEKADWMKLPSRNPINDYETRVKVLYSETGIYVYGELQDNKIVSTLREDNADLWEEDIFEIFLQPDIDYPLYFEYELSPYGFELPILVPNFDGEFLGWLPWKYYGDRRVVKNAVITDPGWRVEIMIPYELLKPMQNVPPQKGMQWKANFYRMDYDSGKVEAYTWRPVTTNFHDYERFGTIIFD